MTNKELLHADMLDIVFDNRNKEYGAYTIRRDYNKRMLVSLLSGLSLVVLFILLSSFKAKHTDKLPAKKEGAVIVKTYEVPKEVKKEQPKPIEKPKPKPAEPKINPPVATVKYPPIKIVPDEIADKDPVTPQADLDGKQISTNNTNGNPYEGKPTTVEPVVNNTGNGDGEKPQPAFIPNQANPEFPGGQEALLKFLSRNLNTPQDLENGEKKMVKAKFQVDKDGSVTLVAIELSGGSLFDKEVIRVCKKMPKWKPAVQNGVAVAMSYVLPVTFIGVEQ